jgi:hypothetical protein
MYRAGGYPASENVREETMKAKEYYTTSNQERAILALESNGVIQHPRPRRFDRIARECEFNNSEIVTVYVSEPVLHQASIETLEEAGFLILSDDGIKISYVCMIPMLSN